MFTLQDILTGNQGNLTIYGSAEARPDLSA